jgi:hypothetical protein
MSGHKTPRSNTGAGKETKKDWPHIQRLAGTVAPTVEILWSAGYSGRSSLSRIRLRGLLLRLARPVLFSDHTAFTPTLNLHNDPSMKALTYCGPNKGVRVEERPKPTIVDPTDAIIRVTKSTICGSDLHILKGDVPTCKPGTGPSAVPD